MSSVNDMDWDNNLEFKQHLMAQATENLPPELVTEMVEDMKAVHDRGMAYLYKVMEVIEEKKKQEVTAGRVVAAANHRMENEAPSTAVRASSSGRALRSSIAKKKSSSIGGPCASEADAIKCLELFTESNGNVNVIPSGKILVQVETTSTKSTDKSKTPLVFLVEPSGRNGRGCCRIGREKSNAVYLPFDHEVSSKHGILSKTNLQYFFEDNNSSNGSSIDRGDGLEEMDAKQTYELKNGTVLHLGQCRLTLHFAPL